MVEIERCQKKELKMSPFLKNELTEKELVVFLNHGTHCKTINKVIILSVEQSGRWSLHTV